jgi:plasmid stabilization system protein ParE
MKIVWSPLALKRVEDIATYIAMDKPSAAEDWIRGLFKAVAKLGRYPESGRIVPEVQRPDIREIVYNSYRAVYRLAGEISVLTVIHGRQMLDKTIIATNENKL